MKTEHQLHQLRAYIENELRNDKRETRLADYLMMIGLIAWVLDDSMAPRFDTEEEARRP